MISVLITFWMARWLYGSLRSYEKTNPLTRVIRGDHYIAYR